MKKRLFISTGYYSTLIAAVIAKSQSGSYYEDYLLITIDRQSIDANRLWALRLHNWFGVDFIDHEHFYIDEINYNHVIENFDEVYSPFPEMYLVVSSAFPAQKYHYYEEGLTSYLQFSNKQFIPNDNFYCLHPYIFNNFSGLISLPVQVDSIKAVLKNLNMCYKTPSIEGNNNVVVIGHGGFPDETKNTLVHDEYVKVIKDFSKQGFNIILLGHTRFPVDKKLLETLDSSYDVNFEYIEHDSPISDLFLFENANKIKFIVGIYSTLLVNAQALYDIKAISFDSNALSQRQILLKNVQSRLLNQSGL